MTPASTRLTATSRIRISRRRRIAFGLQRVVDGRLIGTPWLIGRKRDAEENRDTDEVVVRVSYAVVRVDVPTRRKATR